MVVWALRASPLQGVSLLTKLANALNVHWHSSYAFFILDFLFYVLNGVRWFHIEGYGLTGKCFDENLHLYGLKNDVFIHRYTEQPQLWILSLKTHLQKN